MLKRINKRSCGDLRYGLQLVNKVYVLEDVYLNSSVITDLTNTMKYTMGSELVTYQGNRYYVFTKVA